jgi:chromosomal replication initiator protein
MTALALRKDAVDVKSIIRSKMNGDAYGAWIEPLAVSEEDGRIILTANSRFNADFIRATLGNVLRAVEDENNVSIVLDFRRPALRVIGPSAARPPAEPPPRPDFDGFVCCDANSFAVSAVKKCAAGAVSFSPLVICGPTGAGKSLLLELLGRNAGARVFATTGARFVSDFVRGVKDGSVFLWKDALRRCDMFVMDDIQGLAGKRASADEFMSLLDDLIRMGKNIVLTSGVAPSQITGFDRRLASVLASGLSVDLAAPDDGVRQRILEKSGVPGPAAKAIAARTPANGHVLAGICKKIAAWRELDCGDLSESVLEKLLGDVLEKQRTPLCIVKSMCAKLGVAFEDVSSSARTRAIVFARQKIMCAMKMATSLTLAEIGRLVGRDHASVLYAMSQIEKAKQTDMLLESEISELAK